MVTEEVTDERKGWTSASNAAADKRCAGRHQAQCGMPDIVTADATFGTRIHDALAKQDPAGLMGEELSIYESCNEITDKLMTQAFGSEVKKANIVRERRYWCGVLAFPGDKSPKPRRYQHSGKVDFFARVGQRGLIIEFKTLPGELDESPTNDQLRDQVVLVARNAALDEVVTAINQPLVTHSPVPTLYVKEHIDQAEQEMYERVRASHNPQAKRTANAVSCKFCKARFDCVEREQWSASMLPSTTAVVGTPINQWSPEQRAAYCAIRGPAKKWLEDCDQFIKKGIKEEPNFVPGFTLKEGNTRREVNDPQELLNRLSALLKPGELTTEELLNLYMGCINVRKGDLDGLLRKVTGLKGKALAAKMESILSGIVDEKQNDSSVVKA